MCVANTLSIVVYVGSFGNRSELCTALIPNNTLVQCETKGLVLYKELLNVHNISVSLASTYRCECATNNCSVTWSCLR